MWSPTAISFVFMAIIAAIYEPLRMSLHAQNVSLNIGGVGGVGGLANLLGAGDKRCDHSINLHNSTYHNNYCYEKGVLGPFTPFSVFMFMVWVGPILLAALVTMMYDEAHTIYSRNINASSAPLGVFAAIWIGLNVLWFVIPLSVFWFNLSSDVEGNLPSLRVLAIAIAGAHPLSWNLMVAAIPASGITTKLLGCDRPTMFKCHRFVSYFTVGWGLLHGIFELIYMTSTRSLVTGNRKIVDELLMREDGEDLLYIAGAMALLILSVQGMVGYSRQVLRINNWSFRKIHRALAFALLLVAAAHWWPFYLFLIPAISLHGVGIACCLMDVDESDPDNSLSSVPNRYTRAEIALLVFLSVLCSFFATFFIWTLRENFMTSPTANLSVPFFFPVLCIALSLLASVFVSTLYLMTRKVSIEESTLEELSAPLGENLPLLELATGELEHQTEARISSEAL